MPAMSAPIALPKQTATNTVLFAAEVSFRPRWYPTRIAVASAIPDEIVYEEREKKKKKKKKKSEWLDSLNER